MKVIPVNTKADMFGTSFDPGRECWTVKGHGKRHVVFWPWVSYISRRRSVDLKWQWIARPPQPVCQCSLYGDLDTFTAEWLNAKNHVDCKFCQRQIGWGLPLELLLPKGFPPPMEREELHPIADWWEECGEEARARLIRQELEKPWPPFKEDFFGWIEEKGLKGRLMP